jgi:hypothetical protein
LLLKSRTISFPKAFSPKSSAHIMAKQAYVSDGPQRWSESDDRLNSFRPQVLYLSGDGDPLWFSVGKGSDELIPTGALANSYDLPILSPFPPSSVLIRWWIWINDSSFQSTRFGNTRRYSQCSLPPRLSSPSSSAAQTSWYLAVSARCFFFAPRATNTLISFNSSPQSYKYLWRTARPVIQPTPSLASRSTRVMPGGRLSRWGTWPSMPTRSTVA